jgi:formylglycine-generating enzyme required for sulfatase activity
LAGGPDKDRVLRGGAWNLPFDFARCSYRHGVVPDFRLRYIGFRLVAPPFDSGG